MTAVRDDQHGTSTGYVYGCRCAPCRAAIAKSQRERTPRPIRPEDHGTRNAYGNLKCRCDECKAVWAIFQREQKRTRTENVTPESIHGTENGYTNYGCRCRSCTVAHSAERKARKQRARAEAAKLV